MNTYDGSLYKVGGFCAVGAGIFYVVFAVVTILDPVESATGTAHMMQLLAEQGAYHYMAHGAFALAALLLMGTIPAIIDLLRSGNEGWIQIAAIFGYMGFGVTVVDQLMHSGFELYLARAYMAGDAMTRVAVENILPITSIDPVGWVSFGSIGAWTLIVHWFALRKSAWPKPLALLGIIGAFLVWGMLLARAFYLFNLVEILGLLGGIILGPVVYIWLGIMLSRQTCPLRVNKPPAQTQSTVPAQSS